MLDIRRQNKQLMLIILIFFLLAFASARVYTMVVGNVIYIKGYHIHHFYFGTVALALGGILGVLNKTKKRLQMASALMGIGIGLFADEIGLLLNCTTNNRFCTYAFPDTGDIILTIALVIIFLILVIDSSPYLEKKAEKIISKEF